MKSSWSRRRFVASAMAMVAAPALRGEAAAEDAPLTLRCSLETTPSHMRNAIIRDYLGRIEAASRALVGRRAAQPIQRLRTERCARSESLPEDHDIGAPR